MNENCCSVDWGRTIPGAGHLPSSLVPTAGIWQLKCPHPREFAIQEKTRKAPGGINPAVILSAIGVQNMLRPGKSW